MTQAYTSTVVAPLHLAAAIVVGAGLVVLAALSGPAWLAAAIGVLMIVVGVHMSVARCAVGSDRVIAALGVWGRGRVFPLSAIAEANASDLSWPQVFGIGVRTPRRTTRLTVRPGPTLCIRLRDGEIVRISVNDPDAALSLLNPSLPAQKEN